MAPTIEKLLRVNEELARKVAAQQQQIDWLKRQLFGRKSEAFDHPELFKLEEGADSEEPDASGDSDPGQDETKATETGRKKRPVRKARLPEDLPVIVVKELIPAAVEAAPDEWREMGEVHSDQLEKEPGYFYIRRVVRRKFVRRDNPFAPPVIAPAEPTLIENGFWGAGLLSEILSNKYLYHLPLHRQEQLYRLRFGIDLPRNTMGDAVAKVSDQLRIVVDHMARGMMASAYLQADETPVRYLDPAHPKGSSLGYLWAYRSAVGEVVFDWRTTREHANVDKFLDKAGRGLGAVLKVLQSDGYDAYDSYTIRQSRLGNEIRRAACMAHIRRKFEQASEQRPELAGWFLRQIGRLYRIEATLREHEAPPDLRRRIRQLQSCRIMDLIKKAIDHLLTNSNTISAKSNLGKALRYARGQWQAMQTYLEHGEVEIDNNLIYAARGINKIMPPPDLCRAHKLEAHIPFVCHSIPYSHAV